MTTTPRGRHFRQDAQGNGFGSVPAARQPEPSVMGSAASPSRVEVSARGRVTGRGTTSAPASQAGGQQASNPYVAVSSPGRRGHGGRKTARAGRATGAAARPTDRQTSRRHRNIASTALIVVGLVLLLVAAGIFGLAQWRYAQQDRINEQLASYVTISDAPATGEQASDGGQAAPSGPPQVDWAGLKAINPDVVGWIYIPGTVVNFPVYQGDSNEEYLRTSATGEYSIGGQIFMDYENTAPGLVDLQTIIYGHHLNNGQMFALVDEMAKQDVFDSVTTIWYVTETASYELEPLFFYRTPATNADARRISFSGADDLHAYLSGLLGQASTTNPAAAGAVDSASRVLTLATCDYDNDYGQGNGRGLVVCALKSEVQSGSATEGSA